MLGLGLGLSKGTNLLSNLKLLTRNSDWAIWGDKASGQSFPTLAERTLPNGVKNGIHTKNVSDNYVIDLNLGGISSLVNVDQFTLTLPANFLVGAGIGKFILDGVAEIPKANRDMLSSIGKVANFETDTTLRYIIAKGTTIEQAKALLVGKLIRYQLATPIDTLNSPQVNPIQDLVGVVGKNLFDPVNIIQGVYSNYGTIGQTPALSASTIRVCTPPIYDVVPGQTLVISSTQQIAVAFIGADGKTLGDTGWKIGGYTFIVPANVYKLGYNISRKDNAALTPQDAYGYSIQLELGTVATAYEPYGKANGLLQGFALTPASGYVDVVAPNGKTVTGIQGDGVNDVILLPNNPSIDITGTGDFAIGVVFKTGVTLKSAFLISKCSEVPFTGWQYTIATLSDGSISSYIGGVNRGVVPANTLSTNTMYKFILHRKNGVLKSRLQNLEKYNATNTTNIVSQPHFRLLARISNATGTTHTDFSDCWLGTAKIVNGEITPFTEEQLIKDWDSFCSKAYGL